MNTHVFAVLGFKYYPTYSIFHQIISIVNDLYTK